MWLKSIFLSPSMLTSAAEIPPTPKRDMADLPLQKDWLWIRTSYNHTSKSYPILNYPCSTIRLHSAAQKHLGASTWSWINTDRGGGLQYTLSHKIMVSSENEKGLISVAPIEEAMEPLLWWRRWLINSSDLQIIFLIIFMVLFYFYHCNHPTGFTEYLRCCSKD